MAHSLSGRSCARFRILFLAVPLGSLPAIAAPACIALATWESTSAPAYLGTVKATLRAALEEDSVFAASPLDSADLMVRRGDWPRGPMSQSSADRLANASNCKLVAWGRFEMDPSRGIRKWWAPLWGERRQSAVLSLQLWDAENQSRRTTSLTAEVRSSLGFVGTESLSSFPQDEVARERAGRDLIRILIGQAIPQIRAAASTGKSSTDDAAVAAPSGERTDALPAPKP